MEARFHGQSDITHTNYTYNNRLLGQCRMALARRPDLSARAPFTDRPLPIVVVAATEGTDGSVRDIYVPGSQE